jgi:hypothetical protein
MGFGKFIKRAARVGKAVVTGGLSETKVGKQLGKGALQVGRKAYAATAPFNPMLMGAGLFLQPEQLGIKSKSSQGLFDISQKGTRIAAGLAGAALTGGALAGGAGGVAGGAGGFGLPGLGTIGKMAGLGKTALGMLAGGGGEGGGGPLENLAGLFGAFQGYRGQEKALSDLARLESEQGALLGRQKELAGLDPMVAAQMKNQARQDIRAAQSERGIYQSGVGARQEAEIMPQIDQAQRAWQLQQLAAITGQYQPLMASAGTRAGMFGSGADFGSMLAGGEGGGGGFDMLSNLAGKAWGAGKDWFSGLFGGEEEPGLDYLTGGLSGIDWSNIAGSNA